MKSEILTKKDVEKIKEEIRAKKFNRENNSRIDYLERMIKYATIIDDDDNGGISLNNTVVVKFVEDIDEDDWEEETYKIVTSIRSNSMKNKISIESPIGKALFGKKQGDIVKVVLENGSSYELKVIEIIKDDMGEDSIKQF